MFFLENWNIQPLFALFSDQAKRLANIYVKYSPAIPNFYCSLNHYLTVRTNKLQNMKTTLKQSFIVIYVGFHSHRRLIQIQSLAKLC